MSIIYFFFFLLFNISFIYSSNFERNDFFSKDAYYLVKKINRFSMSKNNEEYMNILVEKLKKYIFSNNMERDEVPKSQFKNIREKIFNFDIFKEGTYDLYSHQQLSINKGYQVSFETLYDSYSNEEYEDIAYKMSLMSDNTCYIGVYSSKPELSFYFEDYELVF